MCEYCRTKKGIGGAKEPDDPKELFLKRNGAFSIDGCVLMNGLFINIDFDFDGSNSDVKGYGNIWVSADINYCPMCGRKLDGGE